jgi:gamma-glutamyltranspeptidase/glutathione hydrolase
MKSPRVNRVGLVLLALAALPLHAATQPVRAPHGMVATQNAIASDVGRDVLKEGGNAVDAAVAVAFALAVVHPAAGNLGGGGFLLFRKASGEAAFYDFRETGPAKSTPTMWLVNGKYDEHRHHDTALSIGVPGTVAGLHLAWKENGTLPWKRLVEPAIRLAREGFPVTAQLARGLSKGLFEEKRSAATTAQFTKSGAPYVFGDVLKQPDLAKTLERIAENGPAGFYEGETAALLVKEMEKDGGIITLSDLAAYRAVRREPVRGTYRGYDVISAPPPSSGGTAILEMLNVLEGWDLSKSGFGSAETMHLCVEAMRRAYADRARYLGDPEANPGMPLHRLASKDFAAELRRTIPRERAGRSSIADAAAAAPPEGPHTTHFSIVDAARNAVSLTYTLEDGFGSKIVVEGAGFLLNNEMGDFNAGPGLTDTKGLIGTPPNLAAPGKRMLSSMSPTILAKDGRVALVTGAEGGRTIINTVVESILDVVDFGMNAREAAGAPRFHHQWMPDEIEHERVGFSPDTLRILAAKGHTLRPVNRQGTAQVIVVEKDGMLAGAADPRDPDGAAVGY